MATATRLARRSIRVALVAALLVIATLAAARLAAPYLVSTAIVRSALASAMARWTGHDVVIASIPALSFWPNPEVTLMGVTVTRNDGDARIVLGQIDAIQARFSLLSAMKGQPDFKSFRLLRPQIRIERDADGHLDWANEGLLSDAVRAATQDPEGRQSLPGAFDAEIGSVEVIDGEITLVDGRDGHEVVLGEVDARLDWPRLAAPLSGTASMALFGETLTAEFATPSPLLLIRGETANVTAEASLAAASGKFEGAISLTEGLVGDSDVELAVSDVPAIAKLAGLRLAGTESWKSFSLTTTVLRDPKEWRFDTLAFRIDGSEGQGLAAMRRLPDGRTRLSGTLAADHLGLDRLLVALAVPFDDTVAVRLPSIVRWLDLDIRLSAPTASFQTLTMTDLGASLIGRAEEIALLIGDARLFGGTLSARIDAKTGAQPKSDLSLNLSDAQLGDLFASLGIDGPHPSGRGSLEMQLSLPPGNWQNKPEEISGYVKLSADDGVLRGFDAAGVRTMLADNAYFQLDAAGDDDFAFDQFDLSVRLDKGVAEIEKAAIRGRQEVLTFTGIAPLGPLALALNGELNPSSGASTAEAPPLTFFVGGTIHTPVISGSSSR